MMVISFVQSEERKALLVCDLLRDDAFKSLVSAGEI